MAKRRKLTITTTEEQQSLKKIVDLFKQIVIQQQKSSNESEEEDKLLLKQNKRLQETTKYYRDVYRAIRDKRKEQENVSKSYVEELRMIKETKKELESRRKVYLSKGETITPSESKELEKINAALSNVKEQKDIYTKASGLSLAEQTRQSVMSGFFKFVDKNIKKLQSTIADFFKSTISGAKKALEEMASYSLSTSLFTNRTAREQALQYGLSDARNWAFTQTKSMLGIQSDEDLYYMNQAQREKFTEFMDKYSSLYESLKSSGYFTKMQEYQLAMKEFTLNAQMKVAKIIIDNEGLILGFMDTMLNFASGILSFVGGIHDFLMGNDSKTIASNSGVDLLASTVSNNDNSRVVNINSTISANSTEEANNMIKTASDVLWTPYIRALNNE